MKKTLSAILVFALLIGGVYLYSSIQSGLGGGGSEYTYATLSEQEQKVVDFIYSKRQTWKASEATGVSFYLSDGANCFHVNSMKKTHDGESGWSRTYEYNANASLFRSKSGKSEKYVAIKNYTSQPLSSSTLIPQDEAGLKDYLASAYAKYKYKK